MDTPPIAPRSPRPLKVGGVVPFTATDYPGCLAAVVFVQGCPWRCGYCHNPHLQARPKEGAIAWPTVQRLLERRAGLLDAVVFSGGEPTSDPGLEGAIREARDRGFKVGLHTGGTHPKRLAAVLPWVDWVGLDIKAPFDVYPRITHVPASGAPAQRCLELLTDHGVAYECRTTWHPALLSTDEVRRLANDLAGRGVTRYALQMFRPTCCSASTLTASNAGATNLADLQDLVQHLHGLFPTFALRNGNA